MKLHLISFQGLSQVEIKITCNYI